MLRTAFLVLALCFATPSLAQSVSVDEIRAQLFLEGSGKLSDNIVGSKRPFVNAPGGGTVGEPANAMLVTILFKGAPNTRSSDKLARDLGAVKVTQTTKKGQKILVNRAYGNFAFGADGSTFRALLIEDSTCDPLEIEVKVGKSRKAAQLDFKCDDKPAG